VTKCFASIVDDVRKANPSMSQREAERVAMNSPDYSRLVADERGARLGSAYRFA
jgi:hypothetical protein